MAPALLRRLTTSAPDAALLRRFVADRDEAAFTELVRRHGPAVHRVCRRLVGLHADDAFQATFLILATRATAVREPGAVGGWLIGVAGRVARQMRKASHRRTLVEQASGGVQPRRPDYHPLETADLARVLDEELTRLPDRLRGPAVLCLVEGRTQEQAAADLGGSVRTVRRRLDEARALLRQRLERRGVVPAVAAALVAGAGDGLATVSAGLVQAAVGVAFDFLAGGARTAPAAVIAKGVTMTLFARKLAAGLVATAVGLVGLGVGLADDGAKPTPAVAAIPPQNLPAAPPVKSADPPPAKPGPAVHVTANFQVYAPTREVAATVADAAERHRKRLAEEWLGKELPPWPKPCPVTVEVTADKSGGASTFIFDADKVQTLEMKLFGPLPQLIGSPLPHEVMHCVLATHFGRALPRWADEGLAVLAESAEEQHAHDVRCREMLNQGRGIQLRNLFKMTEYPRDMTVLFAQGYSVCRFLLDRESKAIDQMLRTQAPIITDRALVRRLLLLGFVFDGMTDGWDRAAEKVYGFESVAALEEAWLGWLHRAAPVPPPPVKPGPAAHATPNFFVSAPTRELAEAVAEAAERLRKELATAWLGKELPPWPARCRVRMDTTSVIGRIRARSAITFSPDPRRPAVQSLEMELVDDPDLIVTRGSLLPREVMRCVLATHFGRPLPRWADESLPLLAKPEPVVYPNVWDGFNFQSFQMPYVGVVHRGHGVKVRHLFSLKEFPDDPWEFVAQSYTVARFLWGLKPSADTRAELLRFVGRGKEGDGGGWDAAAKDVYGFDSLDALEKAWLVWLTGMKEPPPLLVAPPAPTPTPGSAAGPQLAVVNTTPAVARALANELAGQWRTVGRKWIGDRTALTPPAKLVRVTYYPPVPGLSVNTHLNTDTGEDGRRQVDSITLAGPLDRVLEYDTRTVMVKGAFVAHFGHELPDWASAGLMAMEAHPNVHAELDRAARKLVADGQAVRLSAFFKDANWHTPDTKAQGHSVLRFLLTRPVAPTGKETAEHALTDFLSRHRALGWDGVCQQVYGFKNVDDLEAKWIAWLKSPASKPVSDTPAPPPTPRIPATALDGR